VRSSWLRGLKNCSPSQWSESGKRAGMVVGHPAAGSEAERELRSAVLAGGVIV
jgi:hypothetical protein